MHTLSHSAERTKPFSENSFIVKRQRTRSKQYAVPDFSLRYNTDFIKITSFCAFEFHYTAFPPYETVTATRAAEHSNDVCSK